MDVLKYHDKTGIIRYIVFAILLTLSHLTTYLQLRERERHLTPPASLSQPPFLLSQSDVIDRVIVQI